MAVSLTLIYYTRGLFLRHPGLSDSNPKQLRVQVLVAEGGGEEGTAREEIAEGGGRNGKVWGR
eukprot:675612-Amorphochlora_amoeboformis.AAC.1